MVFSKSLDKTWKCHAEWSGPNLPCGVKHLYLLSTPEGHDKPVKYPEIFATSDVVVLNKIDLTDMVDFDRDFFYQSLQALIPDAITFEVSCRTGEGLSAWSHWLFDQHTSINKPEEKG
jgi:hydrogenase nickel incorporation protein HypB